MVYEFSFEGSLTHSLQSKKFFAATVLEKQFSLKIFANYFTSQLFLSVKAVRYFCGESNIYVQKLIKNNKIINLTVAPTATVNEPVI